MRHQIRLFFSLHRLWAFIMVSLTMLGLTIQVLEGPSALAARSTQVAKDPQVIIAVDETPASCITTTIVSDPKTHKRISITHTRCVAGTVIGTLVVSLSQAKKSHNAYVMQLPVHASLNERRHWYDEISYLMDAKSRMLMPVWLVHPATCYHPGQYVSSYSGYLYILNDEVEGEVTYYVAPDCSNIFLDTATLYVGYVPYNNPVWWVGFDYASYYADCNYGLYGDLLYPNSSYSMHPDTNRALGYDGVFDLDTGNICYFGEGVFKRLYVGPLG